MKNIAIIIARSGSKGLKDKNIRLLNGKPLLAYTIEAALDSECFDEVMVSTDSKKYQKIAREYGASVPFLRSPANSQDKTSPWDAVKEVIEKYELMGIHFDTLTLLQPTSPLRTSKDIQNCFKLFKQKKANAVVSMCEIECSIHLINKLPKSLSMKNFIPEENYNKRRQDTETYYRFNGAIYLTKVKTFKKNMNIYRDKCYAYIMDRDRSYDVDSELDFKIVESIMNMKNKV